MQLILHLVQSQLLPYVEDEIERILGMSRIERIEELEAVLVETEEVQLLVVEIGIELAVNARETALMQIVPHRLHDRSEAHIPEIIFHHHLEILVDREHSHYVESRLNTVEDGVGMMTGKGVLIEHAKVFFMEFLYRNQQDRRVDVDSHLLITTLQEIAFLESLTQVGCHGYAALHGIRLVNDLMLSFAVNYRKAECILAHSYREACLKCFIAC